MTTHDKRYIDGEWVASASSVSLGRVEPATEEIFAIQIGDASNDRFSQSRREGVATDFNIARFDLVTMRLTVLCAESGSLSAASKRASCSISAGSQRLSALEATLGKPLFVRDHRGLHLTEVGKLFVKHAKVILNQLEVLKNQVSAAVRQSPADAAIG